MNDTTYHRDIVIKNLDVPTYYQQSPSYFEMRAELKLAIEEFIVVHDSWKVLASLFISTGNIVLISTRDISCFSLACVDNGSCDTMSRSVTDMEWEVCEDLKVTFSNNIINFSLTNTLLSETCFEMKRSWK